ncbi:hypothetical protein GP486_004234 [Trichoglossum hirsutum]|uniref:Uncharacterized protein n=1 Tax=Trichoglossum hirsutum TaxID=265104 RepID=A0A9P8LBR8_9PEZI|nr:hypothetical protein GP486_004234 [Trichoglossum hirsutum]
MPGANSYPANLVDPQLDSLRTPSRNCADDNASTASIKSGIAPAVSGMPGSFAGSGASGDESPLDMLDKTDSREGEIDEKAAERADEGDSPSGGKSDGLQYSEHERKSVCNTGEISPARCSANGVHQHDQRFHRQHHGQTGSEHLRTAGTADSDRHTTDEPNIGPDAPDTSRCWRNDDP